MFWSVENKQQIYRYLLRNGCFTVSQFVKLFLQSIGSVERTEHLGSESIHKIIQMFIHDGSLKVQKEWSSLNKIKQQIV